MSIMNNIDYACLIQKASAVKLDEPVGFKGTLKEFQRKGVAWLYTVKYGLLADHCGLGKTIQALALLQLLKAKGRLRKTLVVVPGQLVAQWEEKFHEFTDLDFRTLAGRTKVKRDSIYACSCKIFLINYELIARDKKQLVYWQPSLLLTDEASKYKNPETKLAAALCDIALACDRIIGLSATPIQTSLMNLHSIYEVIKNDLFGSLDLFRGRYLIERKWTMELRNGRRFTMRDTIGHKNLYELKQIISPYYLRRTLDEVDEELPEVLPPKVEYLELHKEQKVAYKKLVDSTLKLLDAQKTKRNIHILQLILDGLSSRNSSYEDISVKLDRVMELLQGDLIDDKVLLFSKYKPTIATLVKRLEKQHIKYILMTGDQSMEQREVDKRRFFAEPDIQVCIGTVAMEMGHNLEAARVLILLDLLGNPTRMEQFVGRIRRIGSKHKTLLVLMLLTTGTLEHKLYNMCQKRQALVDYIWDGESDIFESLSTAELKKLLEE